MTQRTEIPALTTTVHLRDEGTGSLVGMYTIVPGGRVGHYGEIVRAHGIDWSIVNVRYDSSNVATVVVRRA